MSILNHSPTIVRDGLVMCLDAGAVRSYPGAGPQLVVNGDFASDITTGWQAWDSTTGQSHNTSGDGGRLCLNASGSPGGISRLQTSSAITLVVGKKYRFSVTVSDGTSTNHFVHTGTAQGGNGAPLTNFTLGSAFGTYVHDFVATDDEFWIMLGATGSSTQYYDQVSLVEIASNLSLPGGSGYSSGVSYGTPGANQWSDLSGNNNNAVINNMQYHLDASSGAGGTRYFDFDGSSDYMDLGNAFQSTFRSSFSIGMWVKPADGQPAGSQVLIGSENSSDQDTVYVLITTAGNTVIKYQSDNDEVAGISDAVVFANGQNDWHHIVCTATSGGNLVTYVNGIVVDTTDASGATFADWTSSDELFVGAHDVNGTPNNFFEGKIAIAHVYNRALTNTEIQQNYRTHKGRFGK